MENQTGGNWFDDDPEWQELRRRSGTATDSPKRLIADLRAPKPPEPAQKPPQTKEQIDLKLRLTIPRPKLPALPKFKNKPKLIGAALLATLLLGGAALFALNHKANDPTGVLADTNQQPSFDTLAPKADKNQSTPGKLQYDPTHKVASFTDKIDLIEVTVSQQELPETFKDDPDAKVEELAKSMNANEIIKESSPTAYLGTSIKGPQTAVFHKNGLLIFIYSPRTIEKSAWAVYITRLN